MENNNDGKIRTAVDNPVLTVKNCMHDAVLTAMDTLVLPKFERATKSITGSTGHGHIRDVQNPGRRNFIGNTGKTPIMSTSSQLDLNRNQDRNDETRNDENFDGGDFPALRFSHDRRVHAHHLVAEHNTPHNSIPEYLTGRVETQNDPFHSNSLNCKTWHLKLCLTTHWDWLDKPDKDRTQTQANLSIDLLRLLKALHHSNEPRRCHFYSSQHQGTH